MKVSAHEDRVASIDPATVKVNPFHHLRGFSPWILVLCLVSFQTHAEEGTLKSELDAKRAAFLQKAEPNVVQGYQAGIDSVAESGIYDTAIKIGDRAPDFTLPDHKGNAALTNSRKN